MMMLVLSTALASATELSAGGVAIVNDPFLVQKGVQVAVAQPLGPGFGVIAGYRFFPPSDTSSTWRDITQQLVNENSVSPDITMLHSTARAGFSFEPVRVATEKGSVALALQAGVMLARTTDDLKALQAEGEDRAQSTERQRHPAHWIEAVLSYTVGDDLSLQASLGRSTHIETINATTLELKTPVVCGVSVAWALGSPHTPHGFTNTGSGEDSSSDGPSGAAEAEFQPVGVPSLDAVFDKAKAVDASLRAARDDLRRAREELLAVTGAADLDGVRASLKSMGAGLFQLEVKGGVPKVTRGDAVTAETDGIVGAVVGLAEAVGRVSKELMELPAEVKAVVDAAQEAATKAPDELKGLAKSGKIKPTEVPKLLKAVKGNLAATKALPGHVEALGAELTTTLQFLTQLSSAG